MTTRQILNAYQLILAHAKLAKLTYNLSSDDLGVMLVHTFRELEGRDLTEVAP